MIQLASLFMPKQTMPKQTMPKQTMPKQAITINHLP